MRFYVGSDHGGIEMREQLSKLLVSWGHDVVETLGPMVSSESVDYPDVAIDLSRALLKSEANNLPAFGLLICGTGQGMAISANKIPGIRAGAVSDAYSAKMIREHNDANVICLGQRVLGSELAGLILQSFIESEFGGGRHAKRVEKINNLDR
jgi:ribose 5-phosphate isomerase B